MFRGQYEHTIDTKGRVSVPSNFRDLIQENYSEALVLTRFNDCLVCYPQEEWDALEKKIAQLPQLKPEVQVFQRFFLSGASNCQFDKQGRILIPAFLRQHAAIEKEVVFVGMLKKIELWSKDRWDKAFAESQEKFSAMSSVLSDLGI
ncbi:division/cell wall cluster transcriptional repressor MraZ [bacterium]|nr:division/cell wall cluster transcriptional repressor MraZ [bacterium]